jgi:SNF family Na+-dependent transporter
LENSNENPVRKKLGDNFTGSEKKQISFIIIASFFISIILCFSLHPIFENVIIYWLLKIIYVFVSFFGFLMIFLIILFIYETKKLAEIAKKEKLKKQQENISWISEPESQQIIDD